MTLFTPVRAGSPVRTANQDDILERPLPYNPSDPAQGQGDQHMTPDSEEPMDVAGQEEGTEEQKSTGGIRKDANFTAIPVGEVDVPDEQEEGGGGTVLDGANWAQVDKSDARGSLAKSFDFIVMKLAKEGTSGPLSTQTSGASHPNYGETRRNVNLKEVK